MNQSTIELDGKSIERNQAISKFIGHGSNYYQQQFDRLDESTTPILSFNSAAALLGPVWWAARHLWVGFWVFLFFEGIAFVQIFRGLLADLGSDEFARADRLSKMARDSSE